MTEHAPRPDRPVEPYSPVARAFHWVTAAIVAVQVSIGLAMTYRGKTLNIWDEATNELYSTHKLVGFALLWLVLARIGYRLVHGAPPPEPTLEPWQRLGSLVVHNSLYVLLVLMPILGWLGISLFPALELFGWFSLPALTSPDNALAEQVLWVHRTLAFVLLALVIGHASMALFHYFVRGDNVLWRMLTSVGRR
ncbi:MAG: cytochrome b [Hyphomicrobiaceae bacterium]|nr:cytochrome b [Hyphomicrobiaceae bacterium]